MKSLSARIDTSQFGWGVRGTSYERPSEEERTQALGGWVIDHAGKDAGNGADNNDGVIDSLADESQFSPRPLAQSTQMPSTSAGFTQNNFGGGEAEASSPSSRSRVGSGGKRKVNDVMPEEEEEKVEEPPYKQLNLDRPASSTPNSWQSFSTAKESLEEGGGGGADRRRGVNDVNDEVEIEDELRCARAEGYHPSFRKTKPRFPVNFDSALQSQNAEKNRDKSKANNNNGMFPDEEAFHQVPGARAPSTRVTDGRATPPNGSAAPSIESTSSTPPRASGLPPATTRRVGKPSTPTAAVTPRTIGNPGEYKYTRVADLAVDSTVNIFAVVEFVNQAKAPAGLARDWSLTFGVCDSSSTDVEKDKLRCIAFAASRETLPRIEQRGDIIRMHRWELGSLGSLGHRIYHLAGLVAILVGVLTRARIHTLRETETASRSHANKNRLTSHCNFSIPPG